MSELSGLQARALIDCDALRHNVNRARSISPHSKILAVIKADAYGHTIDIISRELEGKVDGFAVTSIEEGIRCRRNGVISPIVVLSAFSQVSHLDVIQELGLSPVIYNEIQLKWLEGTLNKKINVWLKVDTGMNRLGIRSDQVADYYQKLRNMPHVASITLMSHLSNADDLSDDYTDQQCREFIQVCRGYGSEQSLANSAGLAKWPQTHLDWNRPGLLIYGCSAVNDYHVDDLNLRPVMQLRATITSIKIVKQGQQIGYGGAYRTRSDQRIGVVGFGYGDGYPRSVDERACVVIRGRRSQIVGRVSMDMMTIDLDEFSEAKIGDEVTLWGNDLYVDEVAQWADTIPYELLCKVTSRVPRIAINGTS